MSGLVSCSGQQRRGHGRATSLAIIELYLWPPLFSSKQAPRTISHTRPPPLSTRRSGRGLSKGGARARRPSPPDAREADSHARASGGRPLVAHLGRCAAGTARPSPCSHVSSLSLCIVAHPAPPCFQANLFEWYRIESLHENNEILMDINLDHFVKALRCVRHRRASRPSLFFFPLCSPTPPPPAGRPWTPPR